MGEITGLRGYLPLAIRMLARQLNHRLAWTMAGRPPSWPPPETGCRSCKLRIHRSLQHFGLAYKAYLLAAAAALPAEPAAGPGIDAHAASALPGAGRATTRRHPEAPHDQHLIAAPARGRYRRLRDLLRERARALAAAEDWEPVRLPPAGRWTTT